MNFERAKASRVIAGSLGLAAILLVHTPARAADCTSDAECKPNYHCDTTTVSKKGKTTTASKCVKNDNACDADADCKPGYRCNTITSTKKGKTTTVNKCEKKDTCEADTDCKPGYVCEEDGKCRKPKDDDKTCSSDAECKDGEYCDDHGHCKKDNRECTADAECKAGEYCDDHGKCKKDNRQCTTDAECKPGYVCDEKGKCKKPKKDKCDDDNGCTVDKYEGGGQCSHTPIDGCVPCDTAADCDDSDACTTDICNADGACEQQSTENCTACSTAEQCEDTNECTTEECGTDGSCRISFIPGCGKPVEICGDCIDNDGNGLTDFEDAACCEELSSMILRRGRIVAGEGTSRLKLKSNLAGTGMATINPMKQDVFLQIRPAGATDLLCAHIPAARFMKKHRVFKYWGRKHPVASAQGIGDMKFKVRKDGTVLFKTSSRRVNLANTQPGALQITVGLQNPANPTGGQCASTMASFRSLKNKALIAK